MSDSESKEIEKISLVYLVPLLFYTVQLDNTEQLLLSFPAKHTTRNLAQEFFQYTSYRVYTKIIHVN